MSPLLFPLSPLLSLGHLQLNCFLMLPYCAKQVGEASTCLHCFGMTRSKRLLTNSQRTSIPISGFFAGALRFPKLCKIVHGLSGFKVLRFLRLFAYMQGALVEWLCLLVLALLSVEGPRDAQRG